MVPVRSCRSVYTSPTDATLFCQPTPVLRMLRREVPVHEARWAVCSR